MGPKKDKGPKKEKTPAKAKPKAKAPPTPEPSGPNHNQDICDYLKKFGEYERDLTALNYKYTAYMKASIALAAYPCRVQSGAEAQKLSGIGPKIALRIDEFLAGNAELPQSAVSIASTSKQSAQEGGEEFVSPSKKVKVSNEKESPTGKSKVEIDNLSVASCQEHLFELTLADVLRITDIDKIKTIGQLREKVAQDSFYLTDSQKYCLDVLSDLLQPIDDEEIEKYKTKLGKLVDKLNDKKVWALSYKFAGSYRRNERQHKHFSILITDKQIETSQKSCCDLMVKNVHLILESLKKAGLVYSNLNNLIQAHEGRVDLTCLGSLSNTTRLIKFVFLPQDQFVPALVEMTGDETFYDSLVMKALEKKYQLDKHALRRFGATNVPGQPIELADEKQLFAYLQLDYVKPSKRFGKIGSIAA